MGEGILQELTQALDLAQLTFVFMQELGAFCTMDWSSNKSSDKIHRWGPGRYIQRTGGERLHSKGWLESERAESGGCGCHGGSESLLQPGEA